MFLQPWMDTYIFSQEILIFPRSLLTTGGAKKNAPKKLSPKCFPKLLILPRIPNTLNINPCPAPQQPTNQPTTTPHETLDLLNKINMLEKSINWKKLKVPDWHTIPHVRTAELEAGNVKTPVFLWQKLHLKDCYTRRGAGQFPTGKSCVTELACLGLQSHWRSREVRL